MAAAAAQRTHRLKLLIYGNLLPIHNPLRLAEELAMLDCISGGRIISGFARGTPASMWRTMSAWRNHGRALRRPGKSLTSLDRRGFYLSWHLLVLPGRGDLAAPAATAAPARVVPVTGSKETLQWVVARMVPSHQGSAALSASGSTSCAFTPSVWRNTATRLPRPLVLPMSPYVADSREQAIRKRVRIRSTSTDVI